MSFLITDAHAEAGAQTAQSGLLGMVPLLFIFAIFYFLLLRPQMKKAKEHKKMVSALSKSDEVVISGGLVGKVAQVGDGFFMLEIAEGVEVKVQASAVSQLLPKGTFKSKI